MPKETQTPASALKTLIDEYQLNPYSLSKAINLNHSAVRQILIGKSKVTVPIALRLAKFFGQTPAFWLDLQRAVDLDDAENDKELVEVLNGISKAKKPATKDKQETKTRPIKRTTLSEKRKTAAKVPGSKPAKGKRT